MKNHTHPHRGPPWLALGSITLLILIGLAVKSRAETTAPKLSIGGYAETYFQWNINEPSNGITNYRGFDNRHDTFTLSNVAIDAQWDDSSVIGRLTLQVGHTPSTYYLAKPPLPGAGGANATGAEVWKYIQQAYVGYRSTGVARVGSRAGGIFLSPIGPEGIAVKDNWNWSRSNLFFGLPFYHTGCALDVSAHRRVDRDAIGLQRLEQRRRQQHGKVGLHAVHLHESPTA